MKKRGQDGNVIPIKEIFLGLLTSLLIGVCGSALVALLAGKGSVDEASIKMIMTLINVVCALAGCSVGIFTAKRQVLVVASAVSLLYIMVLFAANLLLNEEGIKGFLPAALMVLAGGIAAVLVGLRINGEKRSRKIKVKKM